MTATHILGSVVFLAACLAMFVPGILQRRRHRRARAALRAALLASLRSDLVRVAMQRDRYRRLYVDAVAAQAALLAHIGDEREAQAYQALEETPQYFAAQAARQAAHLDVELFDLLHDEEGL